MGKKHIVLVTGGQRSGKSGYAQKLALSLTANPVYLATSRVWDEEFRKRVGVDRKEETYESYENSYNILASFVKKKEGKGGCSVAEP